MTNKTLKTKTSQLRKWIFIGYSMDIQKWIFKWTTFSLNAKMEEMSISNLIYNII